MSFRLSWVLHRYTGFRLLSVIFYIVATGLTALRLNHKCMLRTHSPLVVRLASLACGTKYAREIETQVSWQHCLDFWTGLILSEEGLQHRHSKSGNNSLSTLLCFLHSTKCGASSGFATKPSTVYVNAKKNFFFIPSGWLGPRVLYQCSAILKVLRSILAVLPVHSSG